MGRIRTIKPELFLHGDLFDLERDTKLPMRVAWMGLFTACDREGRFRWKPRELKAAILPYDSLDFSRVLDALLTRGFVVKYALDGREYGYIPTWTTHQQINNRESSSTAPGPFDDGVTREGRVPDAISDAPLGEGKGRERKGKEDAIIALPDFVPLEPWNAYLEVRRIKKYPMTSHALSLLIGKLEKMRGRFDLTAVINRSTESGWASFFEPKQGDCQIVKPKPQQDIPEYMRVYMQAQEDGLVPKA